MKTLLHQNEFDTADIETRLCAVGLLDPRKLLQIEPKTVVAKSGISYKDACTLRRKVIENYTVKPVNIELSSGSNISTGIKKLNDLLEGGIHPGEIVELCGVSNVGKTQLCLSLAAEVSGHAAVVYLDSTGGFTAERLKEIVDERQQGDLQHVFSVRCHNINHALDTLYSIDRRIEECAFKVPVQVVVVDSIASLILPEFGSSCRSAWMLLSHFGTVLKELAHRNQLGVVVVNNMSVDWQSQVKTKKPSLGKPWRRIPHTRILQTSDLEGNIGLRVLESTRVHCDTGALLTLSCAGVT